MSGTRLPPPFGVPVSRAEEADVTTEGPQGPVSHLVCGGVYDWSTGLIYQGGRYFDPSLGLWLAFMPLAVISAGRGRRGKRRGGVWLAVVCLAVRGTLTACNQGSRPPICTPTFPPGQGPGTPSPTPGMGITPTPTLPPYSIGYKPGKPGDYPTAPPGNGTTTPIPTPTPGGGKTVYLTFDDGPEFDHYSSAIAEKLGSEGIAATFFLIGVLDDGTELLPSLSADVMTIRNTGHAIGIHGWTHRGWNSGIDYLGEIQTTHKRLQEALGTLR